MSYFELKIGNKIKTQNPSEETVNMINKQYSIMCSDITQAELYKLKNYHSFGIIFKLVCLMDKKTNILLYKNEPLDITQSSILLDEKYEVFRRTVQDLIKLELIKKIKYDNKTAYVINPFYAFKGKTVSVELYELFKNTKWSNFEDLTQYLPKRGDVYYNDWLSNVLERDGYTCQCCGSKINLQAHHIKPYAKHKELRTDARNGITLCECCHSPMILNGFHQKYGTYNNTPEQLQEYIDNKRKELGLSSITLEEIVNK